MLEFVNFQKLVPIYDSLKEIDGHEQDALDGDRLHTSALR